MVRKSGLLLGALAAFCLAWSPGTASADSSRHEYKRDHRERHYRHDDRRHDDWRRDRDRRGYKHRDRDRHGDWRHYPRHRHEAARDHGQVDYLTVVLTQTVVALLTGNGYPGAPRSIQHRSVVDVLDRAPDGHGIVWDDAAEGARYQIVPTETYRQGDGRYCREYLTAATVGGQTREVYGRACRQPDGTWEIAR